MLIPEGSFANCGDWMMTMHADFTVGDGTVSLEMVVMDRSVWCSKCSRSSILFLQIWKPLNTKENPVVLESPAVSNPVFAISDPDRDMMHYNIYRDGEHCRRSTTRCS